MVESIMKRRTFIIQTGLAALAYLPAKSYALTRVVKHALKDAPDSLNAIQRENKKTGHADWIITNPALDHEIEGYASLTSVNQGEKIKFFVHSESLSYSIEIFRMGWYGGKGARRVFGPVDRAGTRQVMPTVDAETGLVECDWKDPFEFQIPKSSGWTSGVYLARLTAAETRKQSYIIFVVREDDRAAKFLFQSSVTTYQAYNNWGGKSLYEYNSSEGKRATKVSFNRPYALSHDRPKILPNTHFAIGSGSFMTAPMYEGSGRDPDPAAWEYSMLRWLEREGYDVTYNTSIDTHAKPMRLQQHAAFLSVGHDEYWSLAMRNGVEAARDHGVNLGFFSSNTAYWQIRLDPSVRDQSERYRTLVCYKDLALDPVKDETATLRWRDDHLNRPEDQLMGVMYFNSPVNDDIRIEHASHWAFHGTGLKNGDILPKLIGYEGDAIFKSAPRGTTFLTSSPGYSKFAMATYEAESGATVFATGSMQWSWALDDFGAPHLRKSRLSKAAQQITRNVLNRFLKERKRGKESYNRRS